MAYPEPENLTGLIDLFSYADSVSDNSYSVGILVSMFMIIVLFLKVRGHETSDCFVVAGFTTSIIAIFLFLAQLIGGHYLFITIAILFMSVVWAYISRD